jgi:tRNA pseudouridine55 synthase
MDGLLLVDKPVGPTSHDVVARMRRALGERRIGHTGTLDPLASGLLPLVIGRATRLASLLTGSDKTYEATLRLGVATETDDAQGVLLGPAAERLPGETEIKIAIDGFRGSFEQVPPAHSAKKVSGVRAYELARRAKAPVLRAVPVTVHALDWIDLTGELLRLRMTVSAGFYVRALARDLGARLGCGAHLAALRRTRSGAFDVESSVALADAERMDRASLEARLLTPAQALPHLRACQVSAAGLDRVLHGNFVGPQHLETGMPPASPTAEPVRLLGPDGRLVALARSSAGALHPIVVLG